MRRMIIMRGLPGSGKTTLANTILKHPTFIDTTLHFEIDHYFEDSDGNYKFDAEKIEDSVEWYYEGVERAMKLDYDVVISNTTTQRIEAVRLFELAYTYGYNVFIIICTNDYGSIHDIPEYKLDAMANRWESFTENNRLLEELAEYDIDKKTPWMMWEHKCVASTIIQLHR